jgi:hypothetical protein
MWERGCPKKRLNFNSNMHVQICERGWYNYETNFIVSVGSMLKPGKEDDTTMKLILYSSFVCL